MRKEALQTILKNQIYEETNKHKKFRQLIEDVSPFIKRYNTEPHNPDLIEDVYNGFWKRAGFGDSDLQCSLTFDEIKRIEKRGKMILLLHPDIFEYKGLVKLASDFSWTSDSWITDEVEAKKIKHFSTDGGCFEVEASLSTPVSYVFNTEPELRRKIREQRRIPQSLPVYIASSSFSLIFLGQPLDLNKTSSRLLGSFHDDGKKKRALSATWNESEKSIDIFFSKVDECSPTLGARTEKIHLAGHKAVG